MKSTRGYCKGLSNLLITKDICAKDLGVHLQSTLCYTADHDEISEIAICDLDDPRIDASVPSVRALIDLAREKYNP